MPVSPQVVYPRGGQIMVDLLNDGSGGMTNLSCISGAPNCTLRVM